MTVDAEPEWRPDAEPEDADAAEELEPEPEPDLEPEPVHPIDALLDKLAAQRGPRGRLPLTARRWLPGGLRPLG